jgi:hypothetical protein
MGEEAMSRIKVTLTRLKVRVLAGADHQAPEKLTPGDVLQEVRCSRLEATRVRDGRQAHIDVYGQAMPATLKALVNEISERTEDAGMLEHSLVDEAGWSAVFRNGELLHKDPDTPYPIDGMEQLLRHGNLSDGEHHTTPGLLYPGWRHVRLSVHAQVAMVLHYEEPEIRCSILERGLGHQGKLSLTMVNRDHEVRLRDVLSLAGTIIEGHTLALRLGLVDEHGRTIRRIPRQEHQQKPEHERFLQLKTKLKQFLAAHPAKFFPELQPYWG